VPRSGVNRKSAPSDVESGAIADGSPRDLSELRHRLTRCRSRGAPSLATVARYMIKHPDEVAFGTVRSIADRCCVSSTSVFRLALNVGFHGFADMRKFVRRPLRSSPTNKLPDKAAF
jgi:DNA-binding MurR/RpiR family transcriptional regulator